MKPDFNSIFSSHKLDQQEEQRFRRVLRAQGFNEQMLSVNSMDSPQEHWHHYEILMPLKTYTLSNLINIQKTVEAAKGKKCSITFQAKKVGTLLRFEFN